jgi:hypothetical protein
MSAWKNTQFAHQILVSFFISFFLAFGIFLRMWQDRYAEYEETG